MLEGKCLHPKIEAMIESAVTVLSSFAGRENKADWLSGLREHFKGMNLCTDADQLSPEELEKVNADEISIS